MMRHGARGDRGYYGNPPPPPGPPGPPGPLYRGYGGDGYGYGGGMRGPPRPCPYSRPYGYDRPPSPRGHLYGPPPMEGGGGGPYGSPRGGGGGGPPHVVHMRGLPFQATKEEVAAFFTPVQPINITLRYNSQGRPNGEADAEFATHDEAKEAMKKDREKIGSRYIELFLDSVPQRGMSQSPGGYGGGGAWNYGPPFFGGGGSVGLPPASGGVGNGAPLPSVGRYNGGGRAPPLQRSYYDSPSDSGAGSGGGNVGYYGGGGSGDYGYAPPPPPPSDDRYGGDARRSDGGGGGGYGGPPQSNIPTKAEGSLSISDSSHHRLCLAPDDAYDRYDAPREMENYYW